MIDKLKSNKKKMLILLLIIFIILILIFYFNRTDGMNNLGIYDIYYKSHSKKYGYTNWSKNGLTNGKTSIDNIKFKIKKYKDGNLIYRTIDKDGNLGKFLFSGEEDKDSKNIYGLYIDITKSLSEKYDICYRTYNKKNKWMEWSCNGEINGNKKYSINKIQVKIIPKNVIKNQYLRDYQKDNKKKSIGF